MDPIKKSLLTFTLLIITLVTTLFSTHTHACTRVLNANDKDVLVGRNMDWFENMQTQFIVYPRGIERSGNAISGPSLRWNSKYGSMVVASYKNIVAEGINEQGLSVHLLAMESVDYGVRDNSIPGLSISMWAQYYLDQFATVEEAFQATIEPQFQLELFTLPHIPKQVYLHLAIEDAQGYSAVIEYMNGSPYVYIDRGKAVLTNSPTYLEQKNNRKNYQGFGGDKPIPGTGGSKDRFVRASWHNLNLPVMQTSQENALALLSVMRNVAQPFTLKPGEGGLIGRTVWQIVGDLKNRVYYYTATSALNIVHFSLDKFDLSAGLPILVLDIDAHPELSGDVSAHFTPLINTQTKAKFNADRAFA